MIKETLPHNHTIFMLIKAFGHRVLLDVPSSLWSLLLASIVVILTDLVLVKMEKANLCFPIGSKSFLCNMAGLAEDFTPTNTSSGEKERERDQNGSKKGGRQS